MKRIAILSVALVGLVPAACQRPAQRTADAGTPSPEASPTSAAAAEAAPAVPASGARAEAPAATRESAMRSEPAAQAAPAATTERAPMPTPTPAPTLASTPAPTPTPKPKIVAAGTSLPIVLEQPLTTKTAKAEDAVLATLAEDVSVDGEVLLPQGSEVRGHVISSVRSGRTSGRARIVVGFTDISVDNRSYPIEATGFDVTAGSSKGKDAKIAGGAAAAGAIIGGIAGGGSGALKGGLIGGAAGGVAVLATRGVEVELKAGSHYKIELRKSLRLR
jgi:type IV secretory pathway VirB10-like protein